MWPPWCHLTMILLLWFLVQRRAVILQCSFLWKYDFIIFVFQDGPRVCSLTTWNVRSLLITVMFKIRMLFFPAMPVCSFDKSMYLQQEQYSVLVLGRLVQEEYLNRDFSVPRPFERTLWNEDKVAVTKVKCASFIFKSPWWLFHIVVCKLMLFVQCLSTCSACRVRSACCTCSACRGCGVFFACGTLFCLQWLNLTFRFPLNSLLLHCLTL